MGRLGEGWRGAECGATGAEWQNPGMGIRVLRDLGRLLAPVLIAAGLAGCGSAVSSAGSSAGAGAGPTPSPSAASSAASATPTLDPVASCATKIDNWITSTFLLGKDDLGDYQEMGLSGVEGMALRNLEQQLAQSIKTFPAAAPAGLHGREVQACLAAGAGASQTIGWQ